MRHKETVAGPEAAWVLGAEDGTHLALRNDHEDSHPQA